METERLILRRLTMDDPDALAAIYGDPEVRRYFPEGTLTHEETKEELEWIIDVYYRQYGFGLWATIHKETGELIGRCGLLPWTVIPGQTGGPALGATSEHPVGPAGLEVELAYLLAKKCWRQGLGTEAARAIVHYGFERLHLTRLICLIDPENEASIKVAENIGMTFEGHIEIDGEPVPLYSISSGRARTQSSARPGTGLVPQFEPSPVSADSLSPSITTSR
jgi:RimJ/RimL family protein N-acetyltransferase